MREIPVRAKPKAGPGRPVGSINKTTKQKLAEAGRQIAEVRKQGRKTAVEVLDELMATAMGMAAKHQRNVDGNGFLIDKQEFKDWLLIAGKFAKALAEYQTPKLRAIMALQTPTLGAPVDKPGQTIDQDGNNVVGIKDPVVLTRVYMQMMKRVG